MAFDAGALVAKLKLDTRGFQTGVQQATKQTKGMEKQALSLSKVLGTTLAVGALGALAVGFKKTVTAAGKFEKSMANVSTLVDTAVVDIGKLSDAVLDMTTEVLKSADDLSAGLYQVFSAGVTDAGEAMEVLRVSAIAATAGLATTADSVKAITGIINAFGLSTEAATDISDLLFVTVKQGVTTYGELAGAIGKVLAPAAALNIKLEELFAGIATLTKGTFDTREATTALRAVFLSVLKPGDQALETAKKLGLEWNAAALSAKGFVKFINEMREATEGNVQEMAKLIPESRALNAALSLAGKQAEEFNKITETMVDRIGASQEAFRKQEATYDAQAQKLGLLVDRILIKIGNVFLPALTDMLEEITKFFDSVGDNFDRLKKKLEKPIIIPSPELAISATFFNTLVKNLTDIGEIDFFKPGLLKLKVFREVFTSLTKNMTAELTGIGESFAKTTAAAALAAEEAAKKAKKVAEEIAAAAAKAEADATKKTVEDRKAAFETLGVVSKAQFDQLVKDQVKAFEIFALEQARSDEEVLEAREILFANLKALADEAGEKGVLGFDVEDFKTRLAEAHQFVLNRSTDTARSIGEVGDTTFLFFKGFVRDAKELVATAKAEIEVLIEDTGNQQVNSFSAMIDEIDRYKSAYITAEEVITDVVAVETNERLAILQRFVQIASGLRREAGIAGGIIAGAGPPITPVGELPPTTTNNISQSVNINNAGNGSVEQGQDTVRAFNQMNASLSF